MLFLFFLYFVIQFVEFTEEWSMNTGLLFWVRYGRMSVFLFREKEHFLEKSDMLEGSFFPVLVFLDVVSYSKSSESITL